jgi:hypothetical protein
VKLAVPTLMCKAMFAQECEVGLLKFTAGQIVDMAYGDALVLKAGGVIGSLVDEGNKHLEAQQWLATYGADCWFPMPKQTISRLADYLAAAGLQNETQH